MSKLAVKTFSGDPKNREQKTDDRNYGAASRCCFIVDSCLPLATYNLPAPFPEQHTAVRRRREYADFDVRSDCRE